MTQTTAQEPNARRSRPLIAFNGWFWGQRRTGSGQYLQQLIQALHELPAEWRIVVFVPASRTSSDIAVETVPGSITVVSLSTPFDRLNENLAKLWFEQIAVPRACRRHGANMLHVPYWATPARSAIPVITTVHDVIPIVLPAYRSSMRTKLYTRFVTWTMRRSTLVLADSHASGEDIRRTVRLPARQLRVVHLAVGPQYQPVTEPSQLDAVRERYKLPERFVLYLGGFDQRKNVPLLIRAFSQVRIANQTMSNLVVAGKLPDQHSSFFPDPVGEARRAGIADQVHFAGEIAEEDKPALYSLATCFVFPSIYEGFGLPVLEAMACGTPVVTSRTSSLGELAGDGGILVDPDSEEQIAEALSILTEDVLTHNEFAIRALERSRQFRWSETAHLTTQAYRDIVNAETEQN